MTLRQQQDNAVNFPHGGFEEGMGDGWIDIVLDKNINWRAESDIDSGSPRPKSVSTWRTPKEKWFSHLSGPMSTEHRHAKRTRVLGIKVWPASRNYTEGILYSDGPAAFKQLEGHGKSGLMIMIMTLLWDYKIYIAIQDPWSSESTMVGCITAQQICALDQSVIYLYMHCAARFRTKLSHDLLHSSLHLPCRKLKNGLQGFANADGWTMSSLFWDIA